MRHAEIADGGIEVAVREWKRAGVAFAELGARAMPSGESELSCGEIDPDGIEGRCDRLRRNRGEMVVVSAREVFLGPAPMLEIAK